MNLNLKPVNVPASLTAATGLAQSLGRRIEPGAYVVVALAIYEIGEVTQAFLQLLATLK